MMSTKNKVSRTVPLRGSSTPHSAVTGSGEVNTLSLVVRKYIARHCVTLASYMSASPINIEGEQAQINKQQLTPSLKGEQNQKQYSL